MSASSNLPLLTTIAEGMGCAFVLGLAAARLRIPPIVGYLLAGVLIGPYTPGFKADLEIAYELSEIGIILLMFGVGLHFSLQDLIAVRKIAVTGAIVRLAAVTALSAWIAHDFWGWTYESGALLGLALSVASTVVLLRSLEEQGILQSLEGQISIGWLIVEDLVMILVLVIVPTLVVTGAGAPATGVEGEAAAAAGAAGTTSIFHQVGKALMQVVAFSALMLVGGKRFLPWVLATVVKTRSRELFTLAIFVVTVSIAFGASILFNVSLALGAFFAGMMIRESDLSHEVADRALPFQDAFAVLFFVAVGMLFDPSILIREPLKVLLVTGIIMIAKYVVTALIVMLFGYTLRTVLKVSAGLSQIGEFSFILITMGLTLKILPEEGRDLILAGAMASIALNSLLFYGSRRIYAFATRTPRVSRFFNMHEDDLAHLQPAEKQELKDLVILVGSGRVGRYITQHLEAAHIDLVIVDINREMVERKRKAGFHAIAGDATNPETLLEAEIHKAVAVVVAVPDPFEARNIVEVARSIRPDVHVLVRAHNEEELTFFAEKNIDYAITGPQAIGKEMVDYLRETKYRKAAAPSTPSH